MEIIPFTVLQNLNTDDGIDAVPISLFYYVSFQLNCFNLLFDLVYLRLCLVFVHPEDFTFFFMKYTKTKNQHLEFMICLNFQSHSLILQNIHNHHPL